MLLDRQNVGFIGRVSDLTVTTEGRRIYEGIRGADFLLPLTRAELFLIIHSLGAMSLKPTHSPEDSASHLRASVLHDKIREQYDEIN